MTSATERLRALLTERGVEWMPIAWNPKRETFYHTPDGVGFCADEYTDGVRIYTDATITPEQAVAATLGPGTCEVEGSTLHEYEGGYAGSEWEHELSCGHTVWWGSGDAPEWCPWCGKRVVG